VVSENGKKRPKKDYILRIKKAKKRSQKEGVAKKKVYKSVRQDTRNLVWKKEDHFLSLKYKLINR